MQKFRFRSISYRHFFTKFYICIHIDKTQLGIVTRHFSHICTSVMALDFCYLCFVSVFLSHLFLTALWSPAGKGLVSRLFECHVFVTFPYGVLGQVWYLIISIPGRYLLPYF